MAITIGNPEKQAAHFVIKEWIIDVIRNSTGLDMIDGLIISKIAFFHSQEKICYMSDAALAQELALTERSVQRRIKRLAEQNILHKKTITRTGEMGAGKVRELSINLGKVKELSSIKNNGQNLNEEKQQTKVVKTTDKSGEKQQTKVAETIDKSGKNNYNFCLNNGYSSGDSKENTNGNGAYAPSCSVSQEEKSHEGKSTTNSIKESPEEYEGVDEFAKFTELLSPFKIDVSQGTIKQIKKACAESCKDADPEFSFYALENLVDEKIKTVIVDPNKDNEGYRFGILMNTIKSSYDQYMCNQIRYRYEREELIQQAKDFESNKIIRIEAHLQQDFNKRKADREDEELMREFLEDDEPDATQTSSSASSGTSSPQEDSFDDLDFDVEVSEDFDVEYNLN